MMIRRMRMKLMKVMIVDDEVLARVGIKSIIPWSKYGFEVVAEAENGKKALELAGRLKPDIIIADIKMPVLDGIALMKEVKKIGLDSQFIILSTYNDFIYVKEALQEGAVDYILKLEMEPEALIKVLKKAAVRLREERDRTLQISGIRSVVKENSALLKENFYKDLIHGTYSNDMIEENEKRLGITVPRKDICCLALKVKVKLKTDETRETDAFSRRFEIIDVVNQVLGNYGPNFCLSTGKAMFLAALSLQDGVEKSHFPALAAKIAGSVNELLAYVLNLTANIGVSNIYESISFVSLAKEESCYALTDAVSKQEICVVFPSRYADKPKNSILFEHELIKLEKSAAQLDTSVISQSFDDVIAKISQSPDLSLKELNGICYILIFIARNFIQAQKIPMQDFWGNAVDPTVQIKRLVSMEDHIRWICALRDAMLNVLSPDGENRLLIIRAKKYMLEHFKENISLETIAEQLGLSPGYFSRIFHKYTGERFVDYLTHVRISNAKNMLRTSNHKVYEISYLVGYDNPTYFSRMFKKETGMSPYAYKTGVGAEDIKG